MNLAGMRNNELFEQLKQTYVMVRRIHTIQTLYAYDDITKADYDQQISELLEKYKNLRVIMGANLDERKFGQDFGITDEISVVNKLLEEGSANAKNQVALAMEATSEFIRTMDILALNQSRPVLLQIKPSIQRLSLLLRTMKKKIRLSEDFVRRIENFHREQEKNHQIVYLLRCDNLNKRPIADILSPEELTNLSGMVQILYENFNLEMKNRQ